MVLTFIFYEITYLIINFAIENTHEPDAPGSFPGALLLSFLKES